MGARFISERAISDRVISDRRILIAAIAAIAACIALGLVVQAGWLQMLDLSVAGAMGRTSASPLAQPMIWVSALGGGTLRWVLVSLLIAALWWRVNRDTAIAMLIAALGSNIVSSALKIAFAVPRPDLLPHLDPVGSPSYPSGHATNAAAVYLLLALLVPPRWRVGAMTAAIAAILLNGASRMMLNVHWLSDILGGSLLGTGFALLGWIYLRRGRPNPN